MHLGTAFHTLPKPLGLFDGSNFLAQFAAAAGWLY